LEEITLVNVPNQKVIGIRKTGKYELIAQLLPRIYEYVISKKAQFAGSPKFLCHEITVDEVIKADQEGTADIELAIPIFGTIEETDDIKCYELAGGTMAKIFHKWFYQDCKPTYEKLYSWIEQQGKQIKSPIREVYLNDPNEVSPEEILTEIYAPIN
jgi:effector-binding domain-containing protein